MNAAALLALQNIDSALTAIDNRRPRLAELAAHRAAQQQVADLTASIAAAAARAAGAAATIERLEHEATELTAKRTRLEAQLKTVIAPREAEALMHEIETINAARGDLDEQELLALDEQGEAERERGELEQALVPAEEAAAVAAATWSTAASALDEEASALRVKRVEAAGALSAAELAAYDHARAQFGGVAVARLEGRTCQGCHLDLSPGELDAVKRAPAGELPECPQCNRFLVH